jgi:hypothetical protein
VTYAIMYDDVSASGDPPGGDGYAGYMNGLYNDYEATKARFPGKPVKSISVYGTDAAALGADICDCETGDYTPAGAAQWARMKIDAGLGRPTIYCNTSTYNALTNALAAQRLRFGVDVDWWEAHYDNVPVLSSSPGAIGKQYQSFPNYDISVVDPTWLGLVPAPDPIPPYTRSLLLLHT